MLDQLLGWDHWMQADFKQQLADWALSPHASRIEELRGGLTRLALDRLGDPRLPGNSSTWLGIRQTAQAKFLEWLSREDIRFFFELVLPKGEDPHGRKNFWLKYVHAIKCSRPLLSPDDRARLHYATKRKGSAGGNHGKIEGNTSAFLLDFGKLLIIEFSKEGNACYVYDQAGASKVIANFWGEDAFTATGLKKKRIATERISHRRSLWGDQMSNLLAHYGIRAGGLNR